MICSKFVIVVPYTGVLLAFRVAIPSLSRKWDMIRLKDLYIYMRLTTSKDMKVVTSGLLAIFVTNVIMNFYNCSICYWYYKLHNSLHRRKWTYATGRERKNDGKPCVTKILSEKTFCQTSHSFKHLFCRRAKTHSKRFTI